MQHNRLCVRLQITYPIIQAGMVWVSDWRLASACSSAGILGTIGAGSMSLDEIERNVLQMKSVTDQPFAVNIPLLRPDAADIAATARNAGTAVLITSAGNPSKIAPQIKQSDTIWLHVVPSVRGARKAVDAGADAVICEGYEAGGHNSPDEITTLALVPQVADAVEVPVVAAGGIGDGRGIAAAMALGADGAQLGTRFIATEECPAHENYKRLIVDAPDTGTRIIGRQLDMLRVLKTGFAETVAAAEATGADQAQLLSIIGNEFNRNQIGSLSGNLAEGAFQAGQSSGLVRNIQPVAALIEQLIDEYERARNSLAPWH